MKRAGWWIVGLVGATAALGAVTLYGLKRKPEPAPGGVSAQPQVVTRAGQPAEGPPWHAPPGDARALPPGTVPVEQIKPPPPDPSAPPPAPREPKNPATHRPPVHNPGGVDGDRPSRKVPGVE